MTQGETNAARIMDYVQKNEGCFVADVKKALDLNIYQLKNARKGMTGIKAIRGADRGMQWYLIDTVVEKCLQKSFAARVI